MTKQEVLGWARIVSGVLGVIFLIFVVIPNWREWDARFTSGLRNFMQDLFQGAVGVSQKDPKAPDAISSDIEENKTAFERFYFNGTGKHELRGGIKRGEYLLTIEPDNPDIRYKLGFLYYYDDQVLAAKKQWQEVLRNCPKNKRSFKLLKIRDEYRAVKQSLLGLAVSAADENDLRGLKDYYRQLINVAEPEGSTADFDEQKTRIDVFSRLAGEGFFSYERAITELEKLRLRYHDDVDCINALAMANYEAVVLLSQGGAERDRFAGYSADAEKYLILAIEKSSGYNQETLQGNLDYLKKLRQDTAFGGADTDKAR